MLVGCSLTAFSRENARTAYEEAFVRYFVCLKEGKAALAWGRMNGRMRECRYRYTKKGSLVVSAVDPAAL